MKSRAILILLLLACVSSGGLVIHYHNQVEKLRTELAGTASKPANAPAPASMTPLDLPARVETVTVERASSTQDVATLQEEVKNLQASLQAKDEQVAMLQRQNTNRPPEPRDFRGQTNWLESLKTTDPDRYNAIVKAREEARQRVDRDFAEKAAFLLKRDKTKLPENEQKEYDQMVSLLNESWQLTEKLRQSDVPREQRWETMGQLRDKMRELEPLMQNERTRTLVDTGKQLGYSDTQAQAFADYIKDIYEKTSMTPIGRAMRDAAGGGGFRGPGGPGGGPGGGQIGGQTGGTR